MTERELAWKIEKWLKRQPALVMIVLWTLEVSAFVAAEFVLLMALKFVLGR